MDARVWLNGRLVDASEATVSFLTPGLHYGIGVFEGIRWYASPAGPAIFRLAEPRPFGGVARAGRRRTKAGS